MPALSEGAFRATFFFSFFGRIVSLLGFRRRLPVLSALFDKFRSTAPPPRATWGIELTVSVSTVMFLTAPSVVLAFCSCVEDFLDCTVGGLAVLSVEAGFVVFASSPLFGSAPLLPVLSLPLSLGFVWVSFDSASSIGFSSITSGLSLSAVFPPVTDLVALLAGAVDWLFSSMASRVEPLPLDPRPGVRKPDLAGAASSTGSASLFRLVGTGKRGLGRSTSIVGVVGVDWDRSRPLLEFKVGLVGPTEADGGGELTPELLGPERDPLEVAVLLLLDGRARSELPS